MKKTFSVLFIALALTFSFHPLQAQAETEKSPQEKCTAPSALNTRLDALDKEIAAIKKLLVEQSQLTKEIRKLIVPKVMGSNN